MGGSKKHTNRMIWNQVVVHWFPSWLDPYPCSFDPFWFLWKWGTPYKSLVQRHFAHEHSIFFAGTPFSDTSHKQCSIPSLIPSYWLVIRTLACDNMLNVFSGMIEESHHQNWGKLNTHRPFYAQICTGHHCGSSPRPPARQLRKWGERLEPVLRNPLKQETRF